MSQLGQQNVKGLSKNVEKLGKLSFIQICRLSRSDNLLKHGSKIISEFTQRQKHQ